MLTGNTNDKFPASRPPKAGDVFGRIEEGKNVKVAPLAEAIGLTPGGLYRAIREKEVEAITIGRAVFVPAFEARRLLGIREAVAL